MSKEATGFSLSKELLKEMDKRRGLVSRSAFVEETMRHGLNLLPYKRLTERHRKL